MEGPQQRPIPSLLMSRGSQNARGWTWSWCPGRSHPLHLDPGLLAMAAKGWGMGLLSPGVPSSRAEALTPPCGSTWMWGLWGGSGLGEGVRVGPQDGISVLTGGGGTRAALCSGRRAEGGRPSVSREEPPHQNRPHRHGAQASSLQSRGMSVCRVVTEPELTHWGSFPLEPESLTQTLLPHLLQTAGQHVLYFWYMVWGPAPRALRWPGGRGPGLLGGGVGGPSEQPQEGRDTCPGPWRHLAGRASGPRVLQSCGPRTPASLLSGGLRRSWGWGLPPHWVP